MTSPIPLPQSAYSGMLGQSSAQVMPQAAPITTATPTVMPAQQVPQTGLIGSEQALLGGQAGNELALQQGLSQSNRSILSGYGGALGAMNQGYSAATDALKNSGNYGGGGVPSISMPSVNIGGASPNGAIDQGVAAFGAYQKGGDAAAKMQADLTGANGQAAQQAAYAQYQSSPAMQYQMDQMQRATERSAAARGGALGGNVLLELQRNASGIASQDYQNQFNNISQVANQGLNAASQVGQLRGQEANIAGQLQQAGLQASTQMGVAGLNASTQMAMQQNQLKSDTASKLAELASMYGINTGNLLLGAGNTIGQNQLGTSQIIGQSRYATGTNLASGRTNAGQAIAQNASNAATNIGNLLSQQGLNISNEMSAGISNTTKMIYDYGLQDKISNENLAAMIANITAGQGTNTQNAYANIGYANAAGSLGVGKAVQGGITQAIQTGALGGTKPAAFNPNASSSVATINNGANIGAFA